MLSTAVCSDAAVAGAEAGVETALAGGRCGMSDGRSEATDGGGFGLINDAKPTPLLC